MKKSKVLWKKAKNVLVGGVNSPVRAFKSVGGTPIFIKKGKYGKIWDADGNSYIDFVNSWGPLILGHANENVISAIRSTSKNGTSFGASTDLEIQLGCLIKKAIPSIELIRFVNSGTEATMSAIRLARGYTSRNKVIKFEGCYHGHVDSLLVKAGSGLATFSTPTSLGIPKNTARETLVLPYNDINAFSKTIKKYAKDIACVIIEPIAANMGVVIPSKKFLKYVRKETRRHKIILIFDEVITGFRLCFGGAQNILNINPDITCLGKIIGGGLPVGAYGGKKKIMKFLSPIGDVYQAGTLSGNPIAMAAGIATLTELKNKNFYDKLNKKAEYFINRLNKTIKDAVISSIGSMFTIFFAKNTPLNFNMVKKCDTSLYKKFFWYMIKRGVYFPPSQFETAFISASQSDKELSYVAKLFSRFFL